MNRWSVLEWCAMTCAALALVASLAQHHWIIAAWALTAGIWALYARLHRQSADGWHAAWYEQRTRAVSRKDYNPQ